MGMKRCGPQGEEKHTITFAFILRGAQTGRTCCLHRGGFQIELLCANCAITGDDGYFVRMDACEQEVFGVQMQNSIIEHMISPVEVCKATFLQHEKPVFGFTGVCVCVCCASLWIQQQTMQIPFSKQNGLYNGKFCYAQKLNICCYLQYSATRDLFYVIYRKTNIFMCYTDICYFTSHC